MPAATSHGHTGSFAGGMRWQQFYHRIVWLCGLRSCEHWAFEGRRLLGVVLLFLSVLMMSTLLLLPIGLPVALFALALIAAPNNP